MNVHVPGQDSDVPVRPLAHLLVVAASQNNQRARVPPPCCTHRWAMHGFFPSSLGSPHLRSSVVTRRIASWFDGERTRGRNIEIRGTVSPRSAVGWDPGHIVLFFLCFLSFFIYFYLISNGRSLFMQSCRSTPPAVFLFLFILSRHSPLLHEIRHPYTVFPEMCSSLPLPCLPSLFFPVSIRAVRRITQHFLDHRKTKKGHPVGRHTMCSIIVTCVVSQLHRDFSKITYVTGSTAGQFLKTKPESMY